MVTTGKLEIAATGTIHSKEAIQSIVKDFFGDDVKMTDREYLFGGYSGSNYKVTFEDGSYYVLKITNGYSPDEAELMCRTVYHLETSGFDGCCRPIPKKQITESQSEDEKKQPSYKFV